MILLAGTLSAAVVVPTPAVGSVLVPNSALVAASNLVVDLVPVRVSVIDMTVGLPLLPVPAQQGDILLPALWDVRNYRKRQHREPGVPRTRDRRTALKALPTSVLRRTLCKMRHLASLLSRIRDKKPATELFHRPAWRRIPHKIPLRAGSGCRT